MSKSKKKSHKGQHRHFTNPEEIAAQMKEEESKKWREQKEGSDDSDSESDDEFGGRNKGVEGLIEIENPNRAAQKMKKATEVNTTETAPKPQLSRREREEIEKQQAKLRYQKLHAEGKTDEARADLARLAIIRKEREAAAKKRDEEKQAAASKGKKK